jgi:hypothetical protein
LIAGPLCSGLLLPDSGRLNRRLFLGTGCLKSGAGLTHYQCSAKARNFSLPVPRCPALDLEENMSKGLSDVARAKIELMNLIRDLENKGADANRSLDRTRDLLRQLERANPEPLNRSA